MQSHLSLEENILYQKVRKPMLTTSESFIDDGHIRTASKTDSSPSMPPICVANLNTKGGGSSRVSGDLGLGGKLLPNIAGRTVADLHRQPMKMIRNTSVESGSVGRKMIDRSKVEKSIIQDKLADQLIASLDEELTTAY